jgi:hypothetical protein
MEPEDERYRFFDDDGNELNPDLIPKPAFASPAPKTTTATPRRRSCAV